jgi:uncharacterized iron-regulated protein
MAIPMRVKDRASVAGCLFLCCLWSGLVIAQASQSIESPSSEPSPIHSAGDWKEWDVLDVKRGSPVKVEEWIDGLSQYDIVYVGEEHHNQFHIEAALKILRALVDRDLHPVLALEMFGWDGQAALDRYVASEYEKGTHGSFWQTRVGRRTGEDSSTTMRRCWISLDPTA